MKCTHVKSKMVDYIDNALYPAEYQEVEMHLRYCSECAELWSSIKSFSDDLAEFVVYPDRPYSYSVLRARMASIKPLEEVIAFMPRMHAHSLTGKIAVAVLLVLFMFMAPGPVRGLREVYVAGRRPFTESKEKWSEKYQEQLDREYRMQMAAFHDASSRRPQG